MTKKHKVQHPHLDQLIKAGTVMDGTVMMAYHLYQDLFSKRNSAEHLSDRDRLRLEVLATTEIDTAVTKLQEFQTAAKAYLASNEFRTSQH